MEIAAITKNGKAARNGKIHANEKVEEQVQVLRVGVIGCGYWGPKLARNFNDLTTTRLEAISDMRTDRLREMQQLYPDARTTTNFRDLFSDGIDAVAIATPVHTHYALAKEALLAGKHVFVEKPLASCSAHAEELVQIAEQRGLMLMVGHTFVYNPAVEAVREVVLSGQMGSIYYLNSTRANLGLLQPDINVMWDLAPHDISMLSFILNMQPYSVSARGAAFVNKHRKLHEVVYLNIMFDGGIMANLRLSWLDPVKQRCLTIVGSQKMLVYDDIAENKVIVYDKGVDVYPYSVTEEQFRASYRHGGEMVYPINWREPLLVECEHFADCIRSNKQPRSNGQQGVKVIKVLEAAQRSLQNGGVELLVEY